MKAKTIKSVLRRKIDAWLASIEDESLRSLLSQNVIVTGGAIASMLIGEDVKDFDIYFRTREATLAAAKHYVGRFTMKKRNGIECAIKVDESKSDRIRVIIKSAGIASEEGTDKAYEYFEGKAEGEADQYVGDVMQDPEAIEDQREETQEAAANAKPDKKNPFRPVFMSTNAITLSDQLQIVLRFYGEPDQIHENYDFVHCTNYWSSWDSQLVLKQPALEALLARELRYVGSKYPICSLIRVRKFLKRGFTISAGQILKMAMQISELNLKDFTVLEEQLVGVDVAYFAEILEKVKAKDPSTVDFAYLIEIVDRML